MSDFEEDFKAIGNCGSQITFNIRTDPDGRRAYSIKVEHSSPTAASFYGVYVLLPQGIPVQTFRMGGIGDTFDPPNPPDCIPLFMLSDKEGMYGRCCPLCKKYFRTADPLTAALTICAYCNFTDPSHKFFTEGHHHYTKLCAQKFMAAYDKGESITVDFGIEAENNQPHSYSEQKQQTRFTCRDCKTVTDILGQYGFCPSCGRRNSFDVLETNLLRLEKRLSDMPAAKDQRETRDAERREIIKQCVSCFEGLGRDFQFFLVLLPTTPSRRKAIRELSFHNPILAGNGLKLFFDIDLFVGIGGEDKEFIKRRFLRRHIYEHNSGHADEKYINESGENVVVGQLIREETANVSTLIKLIKILAKNFDDGFHSIGR